MAKLNHGKKSASTAFLLNNFVNEEALPDHLLPNDSQVRKKRDAQKFFNDIVYFSILQAVRIYKETMQFLESKLNENIFPKQEVDTELLEFLYQQQLKIAYQQQYETIRERLEQVKENYGDFMRVLNAKIELLHGMIVQHKEAVMQLQGQANAAREQLANSLAVYVGRVNADPDFVLIQIPVQIEGKNTIELDKATYMNLLAEITSIVKEGDRPICHLSEQILEKSIQIAADKMRAALEGVDPILREQIINEQKSQVSALIASHVWKDINANPELTQHFDDMHKIELSLHEATAKLAVCEQTLDAFLSLKEVAENQMADIDKLLATDVVNVSLENIAGNAANLANLNAQMKNLDELLTTDLATIDKVQMDSSKLLTDVDKIKKEAMQKLQTQNPPIQENLAAASESVNVRIEQMLAKDLSKTSISVEKPKEENQNSVLHRPS